MANAEFQYGLVRAGLPSGLPAIDFSPISRVNASNFWRGPLAANADAFIIYSIMYFYNFILEKKPMHWVI